MGCCIVLPSHRLPGPAGLPPCSEILQHPHDLPQALGSSSPPNWMPRIVSEDSLCRKRKSWELWKSGRVRGPGEWAGLWGHTKMPWSMDGGHFLGCEIVSWLCPHKDAQDSQTVF